MNAFWQGVASIGEGFASIGEGFASMFGGGTSIRERVESKLGRKVVFDNEEEAMQADADAIRSDFEKVIGKF